MEEEGEGKCTLITPSSQCQDMDRKARLILINTHHLYPPSLVVVLATLSLLVQCSVALMVLLAPHTHPLMLHSRQSVAQAQHSILETSLSPVEWIQDKPDWNQDWEVPWTQDEASLLPM